MLDVCTKTNSKREILSMIPLRSQFQIPMPFEFCNLNKAIYSFREKKTVRKMMTLCGNSRRMCGRKKELGKMRQARERERESNILLSFIFFFSNKFISQFQKYSQELQTLFLHVFNMFKAQIYTNYFNQIFLINKMIPDIIKKIKKIRVILLSINYKPYFENVL